MKQLQNDAASAFDLIQLNWAADMDFRNNLRTGELWEKLRNLDDLTVSLATQLRYADDLIRAMTIKMDGYEDIIRQLQFGQNTNFPESLQNIGEILVAFLEYHFAIALEESSKDSQPDTYLKICNCPSQDAKIHISRPCLLPKFFDVDHSRINVGMSKCSPLWL